jgi:hypothetical protein
VESLPRLLVAVGVALVVIGVLLYLLPPVLGRLPGDIRIERAGLRVYLPITTCLLLSAVISIVLWLFSRWR